MTNTHYYSFLLNNSTPNLIGVWGLVVNHFYPYLIRPDALDVWMDPDVRNRLSWYYQVMNGYRPAKYLLVKRIGFNDDIDLSSVDDDELWDMHSRLRKVFLDIYSDVRKGEAELNDVEGAKTTFLDIKVELIYRLLSPCRLCEHRCEVDRLGGRRGFCGLDSIARVSSAFTHLGEEAPLVPSGTIFFTGCSLKCVFCQNYDISRNPFNGVEVDARKLADIASSLYRRGVRNINYVGGNPDQNLHIIIESLRYMEHNVPLLWNSNMYMTPESLDLLLDIIDIWLPDFKYGNNECAFKYSRIRRYYDVVSRNHKIVYDYGSDMIIRHLVMPNHVDCCTKKILKWIANNIPRVLVNIMGQYRPEYMVVKDRDRFKEIARRPSRDEMTEAFKYADNLSIVYKPVS